MKAIQIKEYGTPDVLHWQKVEDPAAPAAGEARVHLMVAGLNYIDIYRRSGNYPESLPFPLILGQESAGIVEAVGEGVETVKVGDRVAYCNVLGSYAEIAKRSHELPESMKLSFTPNKISWLKQSALLKNMVQIWC